MFEGGGTLFVLEKGENSLAEVSRFQWQDGLFDVVWSESEPDVVVTASGDGILQIWNIARPQVYIIFIIYFQFTISFLKNIFLI